MRILNTGKSPLTIWLCVLSESIAAKVYIRRKTNTAVFVRITMIHKPGNSHRMRLPAVCKLQGYPGTFISVYSNAFFLESTQFIMKHFALSGSAKPLNDLSMFFKQSLVIGHIQLNRVMSYFLFHNDIS